MIRIAHVAASVSLVLGLGGCTVSHPVSAPPSPPQAPVVSWDAEEALAQEPADDVVALWKEADEYQQLLAERELVYRNAPLEAYLARVLARVTPGGLAPGAPRVEMWIIKTPEMNASVGATGHILISTSLLAALQNEAQLAGILAHEIAHFVARDGLRSLRHRKTTRSFIARQAKNREREAIADAAALQYLARSGYDPRELVTGLELLRDTDEPIEVPYQTWLSHPTHDQRLAALQRQIDALAEKGGEIGEQNYDRHIADFLLDAAEVELDMHRLDQAKAIIDRHLILRPNSGRGYFMLGEYTRLHEREGWKSREVLTCFEKAVALAPNDAEAVKALGLILNDLGDIERSEKYLRRYLSLAPNAIDKTTIERTLSESVRAHTL